MRQILSRELNAEKPVPTVDKKVRGDLQIGPVDLRGVVEGTQDGGRGGYRGTTGASWGGRKSV